jgi:excisionase family DNA binding protein
MNDYLTVAEAARELRVTPRTIHRYMREGKLRAGQLSNRRWLIPASEIRRLRRDPEPTRI